MSHDPRPVISTRNPRVVAAAYSILYDSSRVHAFMNRITA